MPGSGTQTIHSPLYSESEASLGYTLETESSSESTFGCSEGSQVLPRSQASSFPHFFPHFLLCSLGILKWGTKSSPQPGRYTGHSDGVWFLKTVVEKESHAPTLVLPFTKSLSEKMAQVGVELTAFDSFVIEENKVLVTWEFQNVPREYNLPSSTHPGPSQWLSHLW